MIYRFEQARSISLRLSMVRGSSQIGQTRLVRCHLLWHNMVRHKGVTLTEVAAPQTIQKKTRIILEGKIDEYRQDIAKNVVATHWNSDPTLVKPSCNVSFH